MKLGKAKFIDFCWIMLLIIISTTIGIGVGSRLEIEDETRIENVILPVIFIDDQIFRLDDIEHAGPMYYPYEGGVDWTYRIQVNGIIHEFEMANEGEALATTEYLKMEYRRRYADGASGIDR